MTSDMPFTSWDSTVLFIDPGSILKDWLPHSCYVSFSRMTNCYFNINHYLRSQRNENQPLDFMEHTVRHSSTEGKLFFNLFGLRKFLEILSKKVACDGQVNGLRGSKSVFWDFITLGMCWHSGIFLIISLHKLTKRFIILPCLLYWEYIKDLVCFSSLKYFLSCNAI